MTASADLSPAVRGTPRASGHAGTPAELDRLYGLEGVYTTPARRAADLRHELIWAAVYSHRERNPRFDRYCTAQGLPDDDGRDRPLSAVPLLPTALFKRDPDLVQSTVTEQVTVTTSSGTQGTRSLVPRCDTTLMRFFASVAVGDREVLGSETFDRPVFHVGPTLADVPDLWIAYVMAGISVLMPSRSYLDGDRVRIDDLLRELRAADPDAGLLLVGTPPLLADLARSLGDGALRLGPGTTVATIGGWKRRADEALDHAAFRRLMTAALGLADETQIRDTFNMVELNSVLFECDRHVLHVPPWVQADARDPRTLAVQPPGMSGVLSFLDPSAVSYPCFLLTDDLGQVTRDADCRCGRPGQTVRVLRRINRVEARGCALKLDLEPHRNAGDRGTTAAGTRE
jgi:long-chain-fatty-acid---luciferin-component ligase